MPRPLSPMGKGAPVPIGQETGWAPDPIWTLMSKEKSIATAQKRTPDVQLVARHYIDRVGPAPATQLQNE
jgi:hypothetical protein